MSKIWTCKIGEVGDDALPLGADAPMRAAVRDAYEAVTGGLEAEFVFSGWGGELDEYERAVVENRPPRVVNRDTAFDALLQAAKEARSVLGSLDCWPAYAALGAAIAQVEGQP